MKIGRDDTQLTKYNYYSVRLLNPFQGILQIVRSDTARALSNDGITWRLQIRSNLEHIPWGFVDDHSATNAYRLYGIWSQRDGLTHLPLHPGIDAERANLEASKILSSLENLPDLPFPLQDTTELWLLNKEKGTPLALLASACSDNNLPDNLELRWTPSLPWNNNFDIHCHELAPKHSAPRLKGKLANEFLSNIVMKHCTNPPQAYWINRQPDGSGVVHSNEFNNPVLSKIEFSADLFPYDMITTEIFSPMEQKILKQYLKWLAPFLLSLQNISDIAREQLEIDAYKRPMEVHNVYRTIPKIVNRKLLNAALVEAELRKAAAK